MLHWHLLATAYAEADQGAAKQIEWFAGKPDEYRAIAEADPPYEIVNSPLEVTVNGKETAVLNKLGWGGTYDLYRVDFRVPSGLAPGTATIQLTAVWIPGPQVEIPVQ
jgi:uncharacterized protein (TIGR03437 family)